MSKNFTVTVQHDHLSKLTKATPVVALSELIWNALDADADKVEVFFKDNEVIVRDNGCGIDYSQIEKLFGALGGSWKANGTRKTAQGRFLHGKEGQGRFKAFAIGRVVIWKVVYKKNDSFYEYQIECHENNIKNGKVSEEVESSKTMTGVEVSISELNKKSGYLTECKLNQLVSIFALY